MPFGPITSSVLGAGSALVGAGAEVYSAKQQAKSVRHSNRTNVGIAREQMAHSAKEAGLNRDFQSGQAERAMEFSASQARAQNEFQERMSNTSYRRAVRDMKAAGINPMLAIDQGGASSPPGAQGTPSAGSGAQGAPAGAEVIPVPPVVSTLISNAKDLISMYASLRQAFATVKNIDSDTDKKSAETVEALERAGHTGAAKKALDYQNFETDRRLQIERRFPKFYGLVDAINKRLGIVNKVTPNFHYFMGSKGAFSNR